MPTLTLKVYRPAGKNIIMVNAQHVSNHFPLETSQVMSVNIQKIS